MNDTPTPTNDEWIVTDNENYIEIASIKTCDSIASVHGGKTIGDQYDLAVRIAKVPQLERELTAALEASTQWEAEAWRSDELLEQRDNELTAAREELKNPESVEINMIRGNIAIPDRAEFDYIKRIKTLTEQRDRLAEALERIANNNIQDTQETDYAYELGRMEGIAKIALQSFEQTEP
jgi:succinate dehydrogenase/fumarate reductase flavoprotein subunit